MELVFIIGAVTLGAVLAYATIRNRRRNRANDAITEAATRAEYKRPDSYDEKQFERLLHPKK